MNPRLLQSSAAMYRLCIAVCIWILGAGKAADEGVNAMRRDLSLKFRWLLHIRPHSPKAAIRWLYGASEASGTARWIQALSGNVSRRESYSYISDGSHVQQWSRRESREHQFRGGYPQCAHTRLGYVGSESSPDRRTSDYVDELWAYGTAGQHVQYDSERDGRYGQ